MAVIQVSAVVAFIRYLTYHPYSLQLPKYDSRKILGQRDPISNTTPVLESNFCHQMTNSIEKGIPKLVCLMPDGV